MKKLYIIVVFSVITSINCMDRPTISGPSSAFTRVQPRTINIPHPMPTESTPRPLATTPMDITPERTARLYVCPHPGCGRTSAKKQNIERHATTCEHNKNKNREASPAFTCPYARCGFSAIRKDSLVRHTITCKHNPHPDQEARTRFKCSHLGCTFFSAYKHIAENHINNTCAYNPLNTKALTLCKCCHCGYEFARELQKNWHEKICPQRSAQEHETSPTKRHHAAACSSHES